MKRPRRFPSKVRLELDPEQLNMILYLVGQHEKKIARQNAAGEKEGKAPHPVSVKSARRLRTILQAIERGVAEARRFERGGS